MIEIPTIFSSAELTFRAFMGVVAFCAGAVASVTKKGSKQHEISGQIFVISMIFMCITGSSIAFKKQIVDSFFVGLISLYLVVSSWLALKFDSSRFIPHLIGTLFVSFIGVLSIVAELLPVVNGQPPLLGVILVSCFLVFSDIHYMFTKRTGKMRLIRHLWRMLFAFIFAVLSFSLQLVNMYPEVSILLVAVAPVLALVILMVYWIVKLKFFCWPRQSS